MTIDTTRDPLPPKLDDRERRLVEQFPDARKAMEEFHRKREWWRRYWRRVAVYSLIGTVAAAALIVWGVLAFVLGGIKSSPPFQDAMRRAVSDPRLVASLGEPIRSGWLIGGSTMSNGSVSVSELRIPISGPKGRATLHVAGTKPPAQAWQYQQLTADIAGGARIDLLEAPGAK